MINQFANTPDLPGHTRNYEVAKYLVKNGWRVDLFASDFNLSQRKYCKLKKFELFKINKIDGIKWHWLRVSSYSINNWKRYLNILSFSIHIFLFLILKSILSLKREQLPNIILASSPQLPAAYFCLIVSKILHIPLVLEIRDLWPQILIDLGDKSKENILYRILYWMELLLYKESKIIVILSKGSKEHVVKKGGKLIKWLPNGPDLSKFKFSSLPNEELTFSFNRPFRLVYAGAHSQVNGLMYVLNAAKLLINHPIEITLIGDGPEKNNLVEQSKKLALNNVKFLKPHSKDNIPKILSTFDAILLSLIDSDLFRYGISPNKLYDAYALGRPVITTVPGMINDEVESNKLGTTSRACDSSSLSLAIKRLMNTSRRDREMMGIRARSIAEKTYSRNRINKEYDKLLRSLIPNE
ncbi:glycosyltransferase family 4 protein [Prochlorococcus marinus]|nr:glycosyltransferase family 4 protein [Prochlorococcus marinus]